MTELYLRFKSSVFAVAFSITADYQLAEDCVTETFVRLAQVKKFDPKKGDGKGFIHKIARNTALEIRRRHQREYHEFYIQGYGDADEIVENSIFINQMLKNLTDKQRQIVVMKCCSELTYKEIAKIMKCPESTVKSRYRKAISILQEKAGVKSEK
jgi:RNA polymerase sigma factor (sigma-70 family)